MFITESKPWEKYASVAICCTAVIFAVWLVFKFALPVFLPFIVAWGIGIIVSPLAEKLSKRTKIPQGVWSVFLMLLLLTLLALILFLAFDRLLYEVLRLSESLASSDGGEVGRSINGAVDYISNITSNLPILRELRGATDIDGFWEGIDTAAAKALTDGAAGIASGIPDIIMRFMSVLPAILLTVMVTLIATYYCCSGSSKKQCERLISVNVRERLSDVGSRVKVAVAGWFRAYLLIMTLTFCELFIGFTILGINYAFIAAALIAIIDILPVLGTGTVLIPWSIFSFITKDFRLGTGLLIIYGVVLLVRQFAEPKIVGHSLGVPPLLTLVSMYAGFRLFGFFGMIAGPAAAMILITAINPKTVQNDNTVKEQ